MCFVIVSPGKDESPAKDEDNHLQQALSSDPAFKFFKRSFNFFCFLLITILLCNTVLEINLYSERWQTSPSTNNSGKLIGEEYQTPENLYEHIHTTDGGTIVALSNPFNLTEKEVLEQLQAAKITSLKNRVKRFACWHKCFGKLGKKSPKTGGSNAWGIPFILARKNATQGKVVEGHVVIHAEGLPFNDRNDFDAGDPAIRLKKSPQEGNIKHAGSTTSAPAKSSTSRHPPTTKKVDNAKSVVTKPPSALVVSAVPTSTSVETEESDEEDDGEDEEEGVHSHSSEEALSRANGK